MVTETFTNKNEIKNPSPHYNCLDIDETKVISAHQHVSKFNFEIKKKNQIFGFPWCSTREDLSIDVSITNVGLVLMKLC